MKLIYRGHLYESFEWDLYGLGEYFKNKQFKSQELAENAVRSYGKKNGMEYYAIKPNLIFRELGDGQVKVSIKPIRSIEKELTREEKLEYLTNKELTRKQLGLYRSYYPVEFGSNEKAKLIQANIEDIVFAENNQDASNVNSIMNAIQNGEELPPPIVDEGYAILDGHHRVLAAKELGIKTIPVIYLYEAGD